MKKKEENNTGVNQSFKLSVIVGIWESLNLHPTVMIYQSKRKKIAVTSSFQPLNGFI